MARQTFFHVKISTGFSTAPRGDPYRPWKTPKKQTSIFNTLKKIYGDPGIPLYGAEFDALSTKNTLKKTYGADFHTIKKNILTPISGVPPYTIAC